MSEKVAKLRELITENLRIQKHSDSVEYVDTDSLIQDLKAKQNHTIFARRGCGKTLLLFKSADATSPQVRTIYLNCEDFKRHSFPDVLLEVLDSVFMELKSNVTGWFGRKRKLKMLIQEVVEDVQAIKAEPDERSEEVRLTKEDSASSTYGGSANVESAGFNLGIRSDRSAAASSRVERAFTEHKVKLAKLDRKLPEYHCNCQC